MHIIFSLIFKLKSIISNCSYFFFVRLEGLHTKIDVNVNCTLKLTQVHPKLKTNVGYKNIKVYLVSKILLIFVVNSIL